MPKCAACNNTILFGGVADGPRRFCNARCAAAGTILQLADAIPDDIVEQEAALIHAGPCPACRGPGPVDFHISKRTISVLVLTTNRATPHLVCRRCAKSRILGDLALTATLGWWGFPFGLIMTPFTISTNIDAMIRPPDPSRPSQLLTRFARERLAFVVNEAAKSPDGELPN